MPKANAVTSLWSGLEAEGVRGVISAEVWQEQSRSIIWKTAPLGGEYRKLTVLNCCPYSRQSLELGWLQASREHRKENPQAGVLELPSETEMRSAWRVQGAHGNSGGSTILTGSHVPSPSLGSVLLCTRVKEELRVDGKGSLLLGKLE